MLAGVLQQCREVKQGAVAGEAIAPNLAPVARQCVTQPQPPVKFKGKEKTRTS